MSFVLLDVVQQILVSRMSGRGRLRDADERKKATIRTSGTIQPDTSVDGSNSHYCICCSSLARLLYRRGVRNVRRPGKTRPSKLRTKPRYELTWPLL